MPSFRGIEISVLTQSDIKKLPEYPHPDGPSVGLVGGDAVNIVSSPRYATGPDCDPTRITKTNPRVSVYIPSVPGAQFWLSYAVHRAPTPTGHIFFKLFMNGRHITSWGINPKIKESGQVEKAFYEPCDHWHHEENGILIKRDGIEARYFHFVSGPEKKSVAEDGGLIEVQVFRAKGRRRKAAKLDQYRHQDKYGISAPSGGLLDNPEDVTFFDFHLVDPKDAPFATFRFHYRSWENLRSLSLIPPGERCIFQERAPRAKATPILEEQKSKDGGQSLGVQGLDDSVFDDDDAQSEPSAVSEGKILPRRASSYFLKSPPQLRPKSFTSQRVPQPSKSNRDGIIGVDGLTNGLLYPYLQRPLPDRPLPELPNCEPDDTYIMRSRKSSSASAAPSITPSLVGYIEGESFSNETVEYGEAKEVVLRKEASANSFDKVLSEAVENSFSEYGDSSLSSAGSTDNKAFLVSPGNYLPTTGSMLENDNHDARFRSPHRMSPTRSPRRSVSPKARDILGDEVDANLDMPQFASLRVTESEWLRRTPSPAPRRILSPIQRIWSPRPSRRSARSFLSNTLRRARSKSPEKTKLSEMVQTEQYPPKLPSQEIKEKPGNWI